MKKSILKILIMLIFTAMVTFSFAATDYWLVDKNGNRLSEDFVAEISTNLEVPMLRIKQDYSSIGQVKDGDSISVVIKNGTFNSTPKILAPKPEGTNPKGLKGEYKVVLMPEEGVKGNNYFNLYFYKDYSYEEDYKNIDLLIDLGSINVLTEGEVSLIIAGNTTNQVNNQKVLSDRNLLLAEIEKANTGTNTSSLRSYEIQANEITEDFDKYGYATMPIDQGAIRLFPEFFNKNYVLWDFFIDGGFNIRAEVKKVVNPRFISEGQSKMVGAEIISVDFIRRDRIGNFLDQKLTTYAGLELVFNGLEKSNFNLSERYKIYGVEYKENEDGFYKKNIVYETRYNPQLNEYYVPINTGSAYSLELFESLKKITLNIDNRNATIDFITKYLDVPPTLINNSTYVPIRFIAENLGAEVEFLQSTNQVQIKTSEKTIFLPIDKVTSELSTPARIVEGRTMVPVRYVSEQLGAIVTYFADTRTIEIIK